MWKAFLMTTTLLLLLFIWNVVCTPAIRPLSQRGIIYPKESYDECYLDAERTKRGICTKLENCSAAVERWEKEKIRPQTCYFNKFDQIVCCERTESHDDDDGNDDKVDLKPTTAYLPTTISAIHVKRRSEIACEEYNEPIKVFKQDEQKKKQQQQLQQHLENNEEENITFHTTVVYGEPTLPAEFPYMAALGWRSNFDYNTIFYRCGGALISPRYVLTAAHCVELGGDWPALVRLGGVNLTAEPLDTDLTVHRVIIHPAYNVSASYNDIALIELSEDVKLAYKPICLWTQRQLLHKNVTAIGYGQTRFAGAPSNQLLKVTLTVVDNDICQTHYAHLSKLILHHGVASTHICAVDVNKLRDTCQGDSGGPLINDNHIVGITSLGVGCASSIPSIYTRISDYVDWIEEIVWPTTTTTTSSSQPLLDVRVDV